MSGSFPARLFFGLALASAFFPVQAKGGSSPAAVSVTVSPSTAKLTAGLGRTFVATVSGGSSSSVTWSVVESGGGTISASGAYTAPATPGTYHVQATSVADASQSAQATVSVYAAPVATLVGKANVNAGSVNNLVTAPSQPGYTYAWSVAGGTLTAGDRTHAIDYTATAAAGGTVTVQCTVTNPAGTAASGSLVAAVAAPPNATITAAAKVTAGSTGNAASVPAQAGAAYAWTLTGGAITGGAGTNAIAYTVTAAGGGSVALQCAVTNAAGSSATGTASAAVYAAPDATLVGKADVSAGSVNNLVTAPSQPGYTYVWSVTGGTLTAGDRTHAIDYTATAATGSSVTVQCTVTSPAGAAAMGRLVAAVVAAPVAGITTASPVTAGGTGVAASVPDQPGSTYAWTLSGGSVTSGAGTHAIAYTVTAAAGGSLSLQCKVTNAAGSSITGSATPSVIAAPNATVSAPAYVTAGSTGNLAQVAAQTGSTYVWTLSGGTITAGAGTRSITYTITAAAGGTATPQCTVTNPAGTSASASRSQSVVAPPPGGAATYSSYVIVGSTNNLVVAPIQTGCTYVWSLSNASITAGAGTHAIDYTATGGNLSTVAGQCTITNAAGAAAICGVHATTVNPPDGTFYLPPFLTAGSTGNRASVHNQYQSTYAWSITGGTITAGAGTPSVTYTVTASAGGSFGLQCLVTSPAGPSAVSPHSATIVAPPDATISAAASVTSGSTGNVASVPSLLNGHYNWQGTGFTITAGLGTRSITYTVTAPAGQQITLQCTVTNAAGASTTGTASESVYSTLPAIIGFSASPSTLYPGQASMLTATFINGTGSVDQGVGAVSSGVSISTGTLNTTTTFTLTVSDGLGHTATATTTVTVTTLPAITGFSASPAVVSPGGTTTLTATFINGTGTVDHGIGAVSSGVPISTGALSTTTTFTLTVSDGLGHSTTATTTVTVTALPTILSFTASPMVVPPGGSAMLTAAFINGSGPGSVLPSITGTMSSGVPVSTGALDTTTTFTLTVTDNSGHKATAVVTVIVTNVPAITAYSASPRLIRPGDSSTLSATFINGTGTVDQGVGAVSSGVPISTGPLSATTTFTLTVKDNVGRTTTAPVTVVVANLPTLAGFSASPMSVHPGESAMLSATFVNGTGTVDHGVGTATSGVPISTGPLNATTTFTITVDDGAGHTATASTTVMVSSGSYSGTFVATGTPLALRSDYTATLLSSGKVLIAGGTPPGSISLISQAELYDPSTGTFTGTGTLVTPRYWSTATLLLNGKVLLAGGGDYTANTTNYLSSAELYDPATGSFSSTGSMSNSRFLASAVLLQNGKVLVVGGSSNGNFLSSAELYDPATGLFTPTGSMGQARSQPSLTLLLDGTVLVTGGVTSDASKAEIYDPNTGVFSPTIGPLNVARDGDSQAALLPDGKVLISGGGQYQDFNSTPPEVYDPASGTFWIVQPLIDWRTFSGSWSTPLLPNGKVLACGGGGPYYVVGPLTSAELYDPVTATFSSTGSMLTKRTGGTVTLLSDGRVLVMGGTTTNVPAELYQ